MHLDPSSGAWHANITVFGAWHAALGYTLDWLTSAPPAFAPRRRMVERGGLPWFMLVDVSLPIAAHRPVPIELHVASVTGTTGSQDIEDHLFACADLVVFHAQLTADDLERAALFARPALDRWIATRATDALVVFQLDSIDPALTPGAPPLVEVATARDLLAIGDRPAFATHAYNRTQLGPLFRGCVDLLLAARDRLAPRPAYAP